MASTKRLSSILQFGVLVCVIICMNNIGSVVPSPINSNACPSGLTPRCQANCCQQKLVATTKPRTNLSFLVEVASGNTALRRYLDKFYKDKLFFNPYNEAAVLSFHERGLQGLAVIQQYLMLFNAINANGQNDNVTFFQVVARQLLKDTCRWLQSHNESSIIDCEDPVEFALILMSLQLRPIMHSRSGDFTCYVGYYGLTGLNEKAWTVNAFAGRNETLRDNFCQLAFKGSCITS